MIPKLTLISTLCQVLTFSFMGLASVYQNKTFGLIALITLAIGLLMNKLINEHTGYVDEKPETSDEDPNELDQPDPYFQELMKDKD